MHCCYNLSRRRTDYSCKAYSPVCWPGRNENGNIFSYSTTTIKLSRMSGGRRKWWLVYTACIEAGTVRLILHKSIFLFASGVLFKSLYFRADHGCAVIKDSKGRTGILVVGGVGDKVEKTFLVNIHSSFQSCVASSVEFLDLDTDGSEWETMPNLRNPRCCSPKVTSLSLLARMTVYE